MFTSRGSRKAGYKGNIGKARDLVVPWRYLWLLHLLQEADWEKEGVRTNVSNIFKYVPFGVTAITPFLSLCLNVCATQNPDIIFLSFPLEMLSAAQTVVPKKQCNKHISLCISCNWRETKPGSVQDVSDTWFLCGVDPVSTLPLCVLTDTNTRCLGVQM